jgi:aspartate aminotransferase
MIGRDWKNIFQKGDAKVFNQNIANARQSITVEFADYIRKLEAEGLRIFKLQSGEPDFSTFSPIIMAANSALQPGETHYASSTGIPALKAAIVQKLRTQNQIEAKPGNVIVTAGGIHGVCITLQTLLSPGDEVICTEPCWMPYVSIAKLTGASIRLVDSDFPLNREDVIFDNIKNAVTPKTKLIILNSPCNPTGNILTENFWRKLLTFMASKDIFLLSDEVYEDFCYDGKQHVSPASLGIASEKIISLFSFSKSYAMTGWRVGYNVATEAIVDLMTKASQYTITCVSPFIQWGAVEALVNCEVQSLKVDMARKFSQRRDFVANELRSVVVPSGSFYILVDISALGMSCFDAAKYLTEKHQVSLAPGLAFGPNMGRYLRLSYGVSDDALRAGVIKLKEAGL